MATAKTLAEKKALYERARAAYYNEQPIMSDAKFDRLEDEIREADPKWKPLRATGTRVADKKTEVELVKPMPSLDKFYPEGVPKLVRKPWARRITSWIRMHKLDGTSLQLVYEGRSKRLKPTRLITRGDGLLGGDISFFIPWLLRRKLIPATIPAESTQVVFRLEGLMKLKTFKAKWTKKAAGAKLGWDNIRNGVNGVFNRKEEHPALSDIDLVVLGVYGYSLASGLHHARKWGFNVVAHDLVRPSTITADTLSAVLDAERKTSVYEMDGLVLADSGFVLNYANNDRPKELVAFKFNDEEGADQVVVKSFVWQKTRLKRWQPKITIPPTKMDGVTVTNATAHNPAWLMERGIGPGAVVKVLRSGGVIPKIVGVVKKAKFVPPPGPYEIRGRFFYMLDHDKQTELRGIHHFMTSLGIEQLALKRLSKLYDAGFTTTHAFVPVATMTPPVVKEKVVRGKGLFMKTTVRGSRAIVDFQQRFVDAGFGEGEAYNMVKSLHDVLSKTIPLKKLMVASGCFERGGMGRRKLEQLEAAGLSMRDLCNMKAERIVPTVTQIKGFSEKTADIIYDGVLQFRRWYKPIAKYLKVNGDLPAKKRSITGPLTGVHVAFTSYRDTEQEATIVRYGGEVVSYGPKMDVLLWRKGAKFMDKINKAGSKAMHWPDFCRKYRIPL
jgi:hypothetical protein